VVVAAFAVALATVAAQAIVEDDLDRSRPAAVDDRPAAAAAAEGFSAAWERSRTATFVASGTYERHSEVTGATLASEDVLVQRPPDRLHRQMGGVEGRRDDRLLLCPSAPAGDDAVQPCRLGPPGGDTYAEDVAEEVAGIRSLTMGPQPLYSVTPRGDDCFDLELERVDPRAPFGISASFCFDAATGAVRSSKVVHAAGISEVLIVTDIQTEVADDDLEA
jgi:hypothetical protein